MKIMTSLSLITCLIVISDLRAMEKPRWHANSLARANPDQTILERRKNKKEATDSHSTLPTALEIRIPNDTIRETTKDDERRVKILTDDIQTIKASNDRASAARSIIVAREKGGLQLPYLQALAAANDLEMFKALIEAGAPILKDNNGHYPLDVALCAGSTEIISEIIESPNIKSIDLSAKTLEKCSQESFIHFCTKYHALYANNPENLLSLNSAILNQPSKERIRAFAKKGFLHLSSYQEFRQHLNTTEATIPYKILDLYTQPSNDTPTDLPAEPYERAKRCALILPICSDSYYQGNPRLIREILTKHPITFTPADEELAWNICACAIDTWTDYLNDTNYTIISTLKNQNFPLPDADFLAYVVSFLIYTRGYDTYLTPCLKYNVDVNHAVSERPKYIPWMIQKKPEFLRNFPRPSPIAVALDRRDIPMITWLKQNGLSVTQEQWLYYLQNLKIHRILDMYAWIKQTRIVLLANPDLILDQKTTDHLHAMLQIIQRCAAYYIHNLSHEVNDIAQRVYPHSSISFVNTLDTSSKK